MSKINITHVKHSLFQYDLTIGILVKRGSRALLLEDPLISETCALEESASHQDRLLHTMEDMTSVFANIFE